MKSTTKLGCLFTMLLAFTGINPIHAQEPSILLQDAHEKISEQRTGSITLHLTEPFDDCLSVSGVSFGINQIADVIDINHGKDVFGNSSGSDFRNRRACTG